MEKKSYAIIEAAGKQFRVEPSQVFDIEGLGGLKRASQEVIFDKVIALRKGESLEIGSPFVKGASVSCEFLQELRGSKKVIFRMRRRKNYRRKKGYRAAVTRLRVKELVFKGN